MQSSEALIKEWEPGLVEAKWIPVIESKWDFNVHLLWYKDFYLKLPERWIFVFPPETAELPEVFKR